MPSMGLAAHWASSPTNRIICTPSIVQAGPEAGEMGPEDSIQRGRSCDPFWGGFQGPLYPCRAVQLRGLTGGPFLSLPSLPGVTSDAFIAPAKHVTWPR